MDFLNKAITQIADLFKSMTPGARITAGLLVALLVVSFVWLVRQQTAGPDDYLLAGQQFSAGEINAMEMAFGKAGLEGYTLEGSRIRVPRGQRAAFMAAIADGGALPADFGASLRKMLEQGGPFITAREREERLKVAMQEELGLWIRSMPGIEKAAVAYDVKTRPGLSKETVATASVSVKAAGNRPLDESRIRGVGQMVASAISEMKPENVVVTDLNTGKTHKGSGGDGAAGDGTLLELRRSYAEEYTKMIDQVLAFVPGSQISVNVELDPKVVEEIRKLEFDKVKSITTDSTEKSVDETRESAGPGGVPGTRSNTSQSTNTPAAVAGARPGNNSTLAKQDNRTIITPGGVQSNSKNLGLQPKRVTVNVSVPRTYFEKLWRKRNSVDADAKIDDNQVAAIETTEVQKIRESIAVLLPVGDPQDPIKPVSVKVFDDLPVEDVPGPSLATNALAWLGNYWSTIGMSMLGLFALLLLRSTVRGGAPADEPTPAAELPATLPFESTAKDEEAQTPEAEKKKKPQRTLKRREAGLSLKEELSELIREDPDAAAAILRSWIGNAG